MTWVKEGVKFELDAIKNYQDVEEAQKEYTRQMQSEYRARKLKGSREKVY